MKKIRVGILGMGYIGESHIEAVRRIGLCELAAVADTNEELARAKAALYGIPKVYSTLEALLADPDIDAVHNCTPNHLHTVINRQIIQSGKHLFSEKPLSKTYEEAASLVELAKEYPHVVTGVNFNYRLNPMVQEMRERILQGDLGRVLAITGSYQQDWLLFDTDYNWRLEPEIAGESCAVADIGSHWMDSVQHVTGGRITQVMADIVTTYPVRKKPRNQVETFTSRVAEEYDLVEVKNEDYAAVLFKMDNGASGVFHVSEIAAGHGCYLNFELNGTKLSMRWNQEENDRLWIGRRGGENSMIIRNPNAMTPGARRVTSLAMGHPEGWNDAFKGNIQSFYHYIAEGREAGEKPLFATLQDAAYIVRLTEAVIRSARTRSWVTLD